MSKWITTLYSNSALLHYKHLKWRWSILLYILIIIIISAPFSVSLFATRVSDFLDDPTVFESDFTTLVKTLDCRIDEKANLACFENGLPMGLTTLNFTKYTIVYGSDSTDILAKNTIRLGQTLLEMTNSEGLIIISGTYDFLIGTNFVDLKSGLENKLIDSKTLSDNFLRSIILSAFGTLALTRILVMMANTTMLVLTIAFFFRFISVKRPTVITYKQSIAIVVQSMFGPALLAALIGMVLPDQSLLLFLLLFVMRFMWLYQDIIHKKVSIN
jgi:hypothetical protein